MLIKHHFNKSKSIALKLELAVYRHMNMYHFNSKASIKEVINTKTIQPELQDQ